MAQAQPDSRFMSARNSRALLIKIWKTQLLQENYIHEIKCMWILDKRVFLVDKTRKNIELLQHYFAFKTTSYRAVLPKNNNENNYRYKVA